MIDERLFKINPFYNMWDEQIGKWFDLYVWFILQNHYVPNYIIGKQDEWKEWVGSNLSSWGPNSFSIYRPKN